MVTRIYSDATGIAGLLGRVDGTVKEARISEESAFPPAHIAHLLLRQRPEHLEVHLVLMPGEAPGRQNPSYLDAVARGLQNAFGPYERAVADISRQRLRWRTIPAVPPAAHLATRITTVDAYEFLRSYPTTTRTAVSLAYQ